MKFYLHKCSYIFVVKQGTDAAKETAQQVAEEGQKIGQEGKLYYYNITILEHKIVWKWISV